MLRSGPGVHEDHQRDAGTLRPALSLPTPGRLSFAPPHSRRAGEASRPPAHGPSQPRPAPPSPPHHRGPRPAPLPRLLPAARAAPISRRLHLPPASSLRPRPRPRPRFCPASPSAGSAGAGLRCRRPPSPSLAFRLAPGTGKTGALSGRSSRSQPLLPRVTAALLLQACSPLPSPAPSARLAPLAVLSASLSP